MYMVVAKTFTQVGLDRPSLNRSLLTALFDIVTNVLKNRYPVMHL